MLDRQTEVPLPEWFEALGAAAWATDSNGLLLGLNSRAERLLGFRNADCRGLPCHKVIEGTDPWGRPICSPLCRVRRLAGCGEPIEPLRMCLLDRERNERWLRVLLVKVDHDDGAAATLLHCACDDARVRRLEEYLERVASGPRPPHHRAAVPSHADLTPREWEVLGRLDQAQSLQQIADALGVTYVTVRNHVQHILTKLDAHSIEEAVARDLLDSGRWR